MAVGNVIENCHNIHQQRAAEIDESGYSLIRLLEIIVVLGILTVIGVFIVGWLGAQNVQIVCNTDALTVEKGIADYHTEHGTYPTGASEAAMETELVPTFIHIWPSNGTHYAITLISATGVVLVAVPANNPTPVAYDTANPCGSAR
ncbi:MAG TPA: hypothetical protein VNG12_24680 [Acidimicrobiales bacterium]|nr:hypothetical protein [Acidimicrobiales bacterium]